MGRIFLFLFCAFTISFFNSCKDDDTYQYKVTIHKPDAEDKKMGESMHIHVDFESETGETVHHVNVRIYDKETNEEVYNEPKDDHPDVSTKFEHHHDFELNAANKIKGHSNYILEAKVWGHEAGEAEVTEKVEFHVHPE